MPSTAPSRRSWTRSTAATPSACGRRRTTSRSVSAAPAACGREPPRPRRLPSSTHQPRFPAPGEQRREVSHRGRGRRRRRLLRGLDREPRADHAGARASARRSAGRRRPDVASHGPPAPRRRPPETRARGLHRGGPLPPTARRLPGRPHHRAAGEEKIARALRAFPCRAERGKETRPAGRRARFTRVNVA